MTHRFIASNLVSLGLVLAVGASVSAASAAPSYTALPLAELRPMPTLADRPAHVAAHEKVEGIYPALPPDAQRNQGVKGVRYVTLFSTQAEADAFRKQGYGPPIPQKGNDLRPCFSTADKWRLQSDQRDWILGAEERPSIHGVDPNSAAAKQFPDAGVNAVRVERLVIGHGDQAALEVTDAWLDPATMGTRLIGRSSVALKLLKGGPEGVQVYAARDGDGQVHYVVKSPDEDDGSLAFRSRHKMLIRGAQVASSDCGHAHLVLRSAHGGGEQGSVRLELSMEDEAQPAKKAEHEAHDVPDSPLKRLFFGRDKTDVAAERPQPREVRIRTLMVNLSVSQLSSEAQPVTSVSYGWQGKERRMQVF